MTSDGSAWNYSHYVLLVFNDVVFFETFLLKSYRHIGRNFRSTKPNGGNRIKKRSKTSDDNEYAWKINMPFETLNYPSCSPSFSFTGLQSRGSGGEELRTTTETCAGGDSIRITALQSPGPPQTPSARSQQQQHYDPEYAKIEAWLDEHREFTYDYFIR